MKYWRFMKKSKSIFSENEIEHIVQAFEEFESIFNEVNNTGNNTGNNTLNLRLPTGVLTGGLNIRVFHRLFMLSDEMIKNLFQLRPEVIRLLPEEIKNKIILLLV